MSKNFKKIILCLLMLSFLSFYGGKSQPKTTGSVFPTEEHVDMRFYFSLLSEFGKPDDIDDAIWEELPDLLQDLNNNIFPMLMLMKTENKKIRMLELFMNHECGFYTTNFNNFLSDPLNKKYFYLAKNKLNEVLFSAGFSYEYIEAFFRKYFTFDRINLKFLYVIKSYNHTFKKVDKSKSQLLYTSLYRNRQLSDWINQKILELEKS